MSILARLATGIICCSCSALSLSAEAPPSMTVFNKACPSVKLAPVIDHAYHECANGYMNGSCETFIRTFRELIPTYDCQRPFDSTPTKQYIVPAIWLSGTAELEDYVKLLARMADPKDWLFSKPDLSKVTAQGVALFGSKEFRSVLDGDLAEEYLERSEAVGKKTSPPNNSLKVDGPKGPPP